jgi:GntR family transcriptional regulator/MocR family aminotransferase
VSGIAAGLHVIATLPQRYGPEERFLARMAEAGVAVRPLSAYAHGPAGRESAGEVRLVLGYAHVPSARIAEGVRLMAQAATG